ncbi:MAG TPA: DUF2206 domain-containing protein [Bacillota bacterium]|nr:DUF2206 domain-containing protein [Bacillota bacterium]
MTHHRLVGLIGIFLSTVLFTALALCHSIPVVASLYQFGFLMIVPGILIALLLGLQRCGRLLFTLYGVGLSLLTLLLGGLLINTILPFVMIERPLTLGPLLIFYDALVVSLTSFWVAAWTRPRLGRSIIPKLPSVSSLDIALIAVPVVLAGLSIFGATSLNNDGSNAFTLVMIALLAGYIACVGWLRRQISTWVYPVSLLLIGASLLFLYSLRSWHIIGGDVNQEFQVFSTVAEHGRWYAHSAIDAAYNACLSITILPASLSVLTHLQPEYIYKLLMQILFGLAPVMVYAMCRYMLKPKGAFFAGFAFAAQTWFIEQMPALVRQEVALLFFMLVCIVLFDRGIKRWQQRTLFVAFTAGAIMSHYSTAYVYMALFLVALLIAFVGRHILRLPPLAHSRITWSKFLVAVLLVVLWEGVITSAGSSFGVFAKNAVTHAADAFTSQSLSNGAAQLTFSGSGVSNDDNLQKDFKALTKQYANERPNNFVPYPEATTASYKPQLTDDQQYIHGKLPTTINKAFLAIGKASKLLVTNLLSVIGLCILLLRLRRADNRSREYIYLTLATIPLLAGIIFLPIASASYNTTRLFLQTYILLVCPAIFAGYYLGRRIFKGHMERVVAILLAIFIAYSSSLMGQLLGGPATITINQPGGRFDSYYVHETEVASARWLGEHRDRRLPVYADSMASLRVGSYGGVVHSNKNIFPTTISQESYVYLDYANSTRGIAYGSHDNGIIVYYFPTDFLNQQKNLIYSNGDSKVYR